MGVRILGFLNSPLRKRKKPQSLYDDLGGEPAVEELVELLYLRLLEDEDIKRFFEQVCMHYQRYKLRVFLTAALGGPLQFTGMDLRSAHARLVQNGLDDSHFDRLIAHLRAALETLELSVEQIDSVVSLTESTRNDVLGR